MRRGVFACLVLLLVACGGPSPAEAPDDEASDETDIEQSASGADSEGSGDEAEATSRSSEKGDDEPSGSASGDDLRTVLQLVLDDEELAPHLKLGQPGRFPLKIAGTGLPDGLVKATKPVEIVAEPSGGKEPVLVFTEIDVKDKDATVRYRYDVENMHGSAVLKKGPHGWELLRSRVVERTKISK